MQFDPIRPTLKAPGTMRLKLKYGKPPSNFAFKFNLRRYDVERRDVIVTKLEAELRSVHGRFETEVGTNQCSPRHQPHLRPWFIYYV